MWLKQVKQGAMCLTLLAGLASFASNAGAASVTFDTVTSDPDNQLTVIGETGTEDTQGFSVDENSTWDVEVYAATDLGPVTGFQIVSGTDTVEETGSLDGATYAVRFTYTGQTNLRVVVGLDGSGQSYVIKMSEVPLPAAAWLFLSMFFGGAWVKRRSARPKGIAVATA